MFASASHSVLDTDEKDQSLYSQWKRHSLTGIEMEIRSLGIREIYTSLPQICADIPHRAPLSVSSPSSQIDIDLEKSILPVTIKRIMA